MDLSSIGWRKSTRSNTNGACVEVAEVANAIAVRDSKDTTGPILLFERKTFESFVTGLKSAR